MRHFFLIAIIFVGLGFARAQDSITISLITTTPGELPHTMFGHSALRVKKANTTFDKIYNFGLFDFETPNFALKFLQGGLEYWLGRQTVDGFINLNNREGRLVQEQVLKLSGEQAQGIADDLEFLRKEENKYYRYSFTKNNCTTQIRDLLIKHKAIKKRQISPYSRRMSLETYVDQAPWFKFGINLMLGREADEMPIEENALYLPKDLQAEVADTYLLVKETNELNEVPPKKNSLFHWHAPLVVFSILAVLLFFYAPIWLSQGILLVTGLMGAFVLYISVSSFHTEFHWNHNLLWCNPLYVPFVVLIRKKKLQRYLNYFFMACIGLMFLNWAAMNWGFDLAVIPLSLCLLILHKKRLQQI